MSAAVDVLIPTRNRPGALAACLATLAAQTLRPLRICISDQSDDSHALDAPELRAVRRFLHASGHQVKTLRHLPRRGMAEQRAFLLAQAQAAACLFLDDDVLLEPDLIARLARTLQEQGCGFVGSALHGLSYVGQRRPADEAIEFWDGPVTPEHVAPGTPAWARHRLHSAANLYHLQHALQARADQQRLYRVAWVGGCVLFDTAKLRAAGGFDFWPRLPIEHCGEDVLAQLRVLARDGGCAILPSGAYHMELPSTLPWREIDAPWVLWPELAPCKTRPASGASW